MKEKKNIISIIMLAIYTLMLVSFAVAVIFAGQKISGAIYFITITISLAFAFLEKKYGATYKSAYRFSIYISDLLNIIALIAMIVNTPYVLTFSIALGIFVLCFVVDLVSQNRKKMKSKENYIALVFNVLFMISIFVHFFDIGQNIAYSVISNILALAVLSMKILLAFSKEYKEQEEQKDDLADKIKSDSEERVE